MKRRPDSESSETVKKSSEKMTERQRKFFKMCILRKLEKNISDKLFSERNICQTNRTDQLITNRPIDPKYDSQPK